MWEERNALYMALTEAVTLMLLNWPTETIPCEWRIEDRAGHASAPTSRARGEGERAVHSFSRQMKAKVTLFLL